MTTKNISQHNRGSVLTKITELLEVNNVLSVQLSTELSSIALSSLKVIEIVYDLEVAFSIRVDENKLADLLTIGDMVEMVLSAIAQQSNSI